MFSRYLQDVLHTKYLVDIVFNYQPMLQEYKYALKVSMKPVILKVHFAIIVDKRKKKSGLL